MAPRSWVQILAPALQFQQVTLHPRKPCHRAGCEGLRGTPPAQVGQEHARAHTHLGPVLCPCLCGLSPAANLGLGRQGRPLAAQARSGSLGPRSPRGASNGKLLPGQQHHPGVSTPGHQLCGAWTPAFVPSLLSGRSWHLPTAAQTRAPTAEHDQEPQELGVGGQAGAARATREGRGASARRQDTGGEGQPRGRLGQAAGASQWFPTLRVSGQGRRPGGRNARTSYRHIPGTPPRWAQGTQLGEARRPKLQQAESEELTGHPCTGN